MKTLDNKDLYERIEVLEKATNDIEKRLKVIEDIVLSQEDLTLMLEELRDLVIEHSNLSNIIHEKISILTRSRLWKICKYSMLN